MLLKRKKKEKKADVNFFRCFCFEISFFSFLLLDHWSPPTDIVLEAAAAARAAEARAARAVAAAAHVAVAIQLEIVLK